MANYCKIWIRIRRSQRILALASNMILEKGENFPFRSQVMVTKPPAC